MKAEEKLEERRLAGGVEGGGEEGRGVNFLKVYNILKEHPTTQAAWLGLHQDGC